MPSLTVHEVASLFDRIGEEHLCVFDWVPNERLDHERQFTLRLKHRFINKFKNYTCIFSDLEECWIEFCGVFQDNMAIIYKLHDIQKKIKKIVDPDNYTLVSETTGISNNVGKTTSNNNRSSINNLEDTEKWGTISGQGSRTAQDIMFDAEGHRKLLEETTANKNEAAFMQYLSPTVTDFQQNFNKDIKNSKSSTNEITDSTATSSAISNTDAKTKRSVEAVNEVNALAAVIPQLIANFLECFNVLYYV